MTKQLLSKGLFCSEEKVDKIESRPGAPLWLVQETQLVKAGLLKLMHNVLLLRDAETPDIFTPVSKILPQLVLPSLEDVMGLTQAFALTHAQMLASPQSDSVGIKGWQ